MAQPPVDRNLSRRLSGDARNIGETVLRCPDRDELQAYLNAKGIGTEIDYPVPLHLQPCYQHLGYKRGDFPVSEKLAAESLALPVYPELNSEDIDYICDSIGSFYASPREADSQAE